MVVVSNPHLIIESVTNMHESVGTGQKIVQYLVILSLPISVALTAYFTARFMPMFLYYDTHSALLRAIIDVSGVLIGFSGIIATFQVKREHSAQSENRNLNLVSFQRGILIGAAVTFLFLVISILIGLAGLAALRQGEYSTTILSQFSTWFLVAGVWGILWILSLHVTIQR